MTPRKKNIIKNPELTDNINFLMKKSKANNSPIWKYIAKSLGKAKRKRIAVNISKIARFTKQDDEVIIPGKVLGMGLIDHPVKIAAFSFSKQAKLKIIQAKGECLSIVDFVNVYSKGKKIKIIV